MDTPTPIQLAESPWTDPWDGRLSGTYHVRLLDSEPDDPDHLVVYLRGAGGDADCEYVALTTICGLDLDAATRAVRVGNVCAGCRAGVAQAFSAARTELADRIPGMLED